VELALYRIAQETMSNVVHHARASHAEVHLDFTSGAVALTITDDGRGFDVPDNLADLAPEGHYGLLGLYERAELVGGRLTIQSEPNQGTCMTIKLPDLSTPVN
jgi:signal transduction histidine kinase